MTQTFRHRPVPAGTAVSLSPIAQAIRHHGLCMAMLASATAWTGTAAAQAQEATAAGSTLPPVQVRARADQDPDELPKAYSGGQVARGGRVGMLGNQDFMSTPFSQTALTEKYLQDQQVKRLSDALYTDPSVRAASIRTFDNYLIRGFRVQRGDQALDGLFGMLHPYTAEMYAVERVEVMKGPSALITGFPPGGSVGGVINLIPKRAADEPLTRVTASYTSDANFGTHLDLGRRFGDDNRWGVRTNVAVRSGDLSTDRERERVAAGAVALDFRDRGLRATLDLGVEDSTIRGTRNGYALSGLSSVPKAPSPELNATMSGDARFGKHYYGMTRLEYDVAEKTTVGVAYGQTYSYHDFGNTQISVTDLAGNATIQANYYSEFYRIRTGEAYLRTELQTGAVKHKLSFVASGGSRHFHWSDDVFTPQFDTNIYNPIDYNYKVTRVEPIYPVIHNVYQSQAIADTMSFLDDRVNLTIGLRRQTVKSDAYDKTKNTPAVAVSVRPWERVSVYANYIEGLQQGPTAPRNNVPALVNAGQVFPPNVTKQKEVGVKADLGSFAVTAAVFDISQQASLIVGDRFTVDGEQRNRGLELFTFGEPVRGLRVLGGVTFYDAKLVRTAGGSNDGHTPVGIPDYQLNLGADWDVPGVPGLSLSGQVIHSDRQYLNAGNTLSIPSWTRFDAGARYVFKGSTGKDITLRLNVENLANRGFWEVAFNNAVAAAKPRTVALSAQFDF